MKYTPFAACLAVLATFLTVAACSKTSSPPPADRLPVRKDFQWSREGNLPKVYLIFKQPTDSFALWRFTTYHYDAAYNIIRSVDSDQLVTNNGYIIDSVKGVEQRVRNFEYNNGKLVKVSSPNAAGPTFIYSYNDQGQLIKIDEGFYFQTLTYSSNGDTITKTIWEPNGTKAVIIDKFYFLNNHLQKMESFDPSGNIGSGPSLIVDNYRYDQNHTPFDAAPKNRFVEPYSLAMLSENNVLSRESRDDLGGWFSSSSIYQYNSSGYPYQVQTMRRVNGEPSGIPTSGYFFYINR